MNPHANCIDISLALGREDAPWPGDPAFSTTAAATSDTGGITSSLRLCAHSGTHIDTPAHILDGGARLGDYAPHNFILHALVVDIQEANTVTAQHIDALPEDSPQALLFRTRNTRNGLAHTGQFSPDFAAFTPDAGRALAGRDLRLVGIDAPSVDAASAHDLPVHHALLSRGILLLENLNLHHAAPGLYTLCCLPLSMPDLEASPVRAVLLPAT
jgi:arylformamidase